MNSSVLSTAQKMIQNAKKLSDVNNWLYRHHDFLSKIGVITGDRAKTELKAVAKSQIEKDYYAGAMATLRKLNDIRSSSFYDYNSYELVTLKELKKRILSK